MFGLGFPEMVIISIALAIIVFGGDKMQGIAKGLGKFTGEFKKGKLEIEDEIKKTRGDFKNDESEIEEEIKKTKEDLKESEPEDVLEKNTEQEIKEIGGGLKKGVSKNKSEIKKEIKRLKKSLKVMAKNQKKLKKVELN